MWTVIWFVVGCYVVNALAIRCGEWLEPSHDDSEVLVVLWVASIGTVWIVVPLVAWATARRFGAPMATWFGVHVLGGRK